MAAESRTKRSLLNARVNSTYYLVALFISFFTRKIFIDCMGAEFMGLTTTLGSLLGFLNLAELGVGAAISYTLYKPLAEQNRGEIDKIISILGYIYSRVGYTILALGAAVALFLPLIFEGSGVSMEIIYFAFFCYLASSVIGYFLNYPSTLFNADQRGYEITRYSKGASIIRLLCAAAIAKWSGNLYLFVAVDLLFGVVAALIIQWRVAETYPWLNTSISNARGYLREYPSIIEKTKQLFAHKVGWLVQSQLAPIVIYSFASLAVVTLYTNYMTIISKLSLATDVVLGSTYASVGNLVAEGDRSKIMGIYYEMLALRLTIASYIVFMLYMLTDDFVTIWLGAEYLLDNSTLIVILISTYIQYYMSATEQFTSGYGLFRDVWSSYANAAISIVGSIVGGYYYGLVGVLLGSLASSILIYAVWKPYFLFRHGFKCGVGGYWLYLLKHLALFALCGVAAYTLANELKMGGGEDFIELLLSGVYISATFLLIYIPILWIFDHPSRVLFSRVTRLVTR